MTSDDDSGRVALTVHGVAGAVDLVVPLGASAADVAREYAAQAGLRVVPALGTAAGRLLDPGALLAGEGVRSGALLVALDEPVTPSARPAPPTSPPRPIWHGSGCPPDGT